MKQLYFAGLPPLPRTAIVFILDRSGSMNSIADETVAGFNRFVADQQLALPEANLTLVLFNQFPQVVYNRTPINQVPPLTRETFVPAGGTALLDAIGETIVQELGATAERVITAILTDGLENASLKFSRAAISDLIQERQANGWQFLFLGADQDAISEGGSLGIAASNSLGFAATGAGTTSAFASASAFVQSFSNLAPVKSKSSLPDLDAEAQQKLARDARNQRPSKN
jgi:hypothetical protein